MSTSETQNSSDNENICCVCFKNVDIYSVGPCDHPVCFECSTRMRVLCQQNECPICRTDMSKVIFTKKIEPYNQLFPRFENSNLQDRKYGLVFCTSDIQKAYFKLLEHRCKICDEKEQTTWPFKKFQNLKDHMRREHELFYCDICVNNLKIFSFERRCYNRPDLAHHRRKGDLDNTSHRGHPLCVFCDIRYMDNDELYRHLRRDHFFCYICDAEGMNQYYKLIDDLRKHFRDDHYLCEEGECATSPLTAVFRTDIDLKAHIATEHSKNKSKSATKQARTLELEINLAPRQRADYRNKRMVDRRERLEDEGPSYTDPGGPIPTVSEPPVKTLTAQDFPALGNGGTVLPKPLATVNFTSKFNKFSGEDFPSLGGSSSRSAPGVTITTNASSSRLNRAPEVTITRTVRNQSNKNKESFPALGGPSTSGLVNKSNTVQLSVHNTPNVSIQVNHTSNGAITTHITTASSKPAEAFPALGKATKCVQPQWVQQKPKKQEVKSKVAPAPELPPSDLTQFPTLSKKTKKSVSVTLPVSNNWVNLKELNKNSNNNIPESGSKNQSEPAKVQEPKASEGESKGKSKKKKKGGGEDLEAKSKTNNNETKNGLVKKRSELQIGALSLSEETDNSRGSGVKPPPGFNLKPPPGFSNTDFPSLGNCNNLTFTNSTGQSYTIVPGTKTYQPPTNFTLRNQNLIQKFLASLNNKQAIQEFKNYSDLFRKGTLSADKYYEHCKVALNSSFDEVFPELLVLLPDIDKQQELYAIHSGKSKNNLVVCENCRQVVLKKELPEHYNYHRLDNHFPSLGKATPQNNVWKK